MWRCRPGLDLDPITPPQQTVTADQHMRDRTNRAPRTSRPDPLLPVTVVWERRTRHRAQPHGHNRPAQSEHSNSPANKARSTSSGSVPTIFNSAPGHQEGPSRHRQSVRTGRALARSVQALSHERQREQQKPPPFNHPRRRCRYTNRASSTTMALNSDEQWGDRDCWQLGL